MNGRYIISVDKDSEGARFVAFTDDDMIYDSETHQYTPTEKLVKNTLGIDLADIDEDKQVYLDDIRRQTYEWLDMINTNNFHFEIYEFKIGRTIAGRNGIKEMFIAQIRYSDRTGMDMVEHDEKRLSERMTWVGRAERYNRLGFSGGYGYMVNPDITDDNGYRNGY